jgi:hypothetical protein
VKDPDARWQSAGDLASELKWIAEGGASADVQTASPGAARKSLFFAWALAGVALAAAIVLAFFHFGAHEATPVVRTYVAISLQRCPNISTVTHPAM